MRPHFEIRAVKPSVCLRESCIPSPVFGALSATVEPLHELSWHGRRRVMLKVSGEALQGSVGFGIDPQVGN
jgi:hypothetical protein